MEKLKIGVVIGSTREGRFAETAARWIHDHAKRRAELDVELIDLRDYRLPFYEDPAAPEYATRAEVKRAWRRKVESLDGYIMTVAEYNRGPTAVLKNALDYAYSEWNNKPVAFIGYGGVGAARAIEQLRLHAIELQMAPIRQAVHILFPDYLAVAKGETTLSDIQHLNQGATQMLDQLVWWARALKAARNADAAVRTQAA